MPTSMAAVATFEQTHSDNPFSLPVELTLLSFEQQQQQQQQQQKTSVAPSASSSLSCSPKAGTSFAADAAKKGEGNHSKKPAVGTHCDEDMIVSSASDDSCEEGGPLSPSSTSTSPTASVQQGDKDGEKTDVKVLTCSHCRKILAVKTDEDKTLFFSDAFSKQNRSLNSLEKLLVLEKVRADEERRKSQKVLMRK